MSALLTVAIVISSAVAVDAIVAARLKPTAVFSNVRLIDISVLP
jgi:hypothetical protein